MNTKCCFCKTENVQREVVTGINFASGSRSWNPVCEDCIRKTRWINFEVRTLGSQTFTLTEALEVVLDLADPGEDENNYKAWRIVRDFQTELGYILPHLDTIREFLKALDKDS